LVVVDFARNGLWDNINLYACCIYYIVITLPNPMCTIGLAWSTDLLFVEFFIKIIDLNNIVM